jgi:serine protease Do
MKTKSIVIVALLGFLPLAGFSQPPNPPIPPSPPVSPVPPIPPDKPEKMQKVPVTFLGVETSSVPSVVCDQLGIAKGFGLVVDYVVPDGPAAAAGVQQNDILKMLNDQILLEPGQLAKLVRSYSEGTTVTLTVLRKGQEQKIPVKLTKKEVPKRHAFGPGHNMDFNYDLGDVDLGNLKERLQGLKENMKDQFGERGDMVHDAVMTAQAEAQRIRDEAQRARDRAQRVRDEAQRARDEAHRVRDESRKAGQIKVTRTGDNGLMTTKIDIGKAQIVFSDDKGELRLERADGKQILTAKDPKGMLLFSGPVETTEERDKIPAEARARFEKLEQRDLPSVTMDENGDEDDSGAMDESDDEDAASVEQVSVCPQSLPHSFCAFRTVLI